MDNKKTNMAGTHQSKEAGHHKGLNEGQRKSISKNVSSKETGEHAGRSASHGKMVESEHASSKKKQ